MFLRVDYFKAKNNVYSINVGDAIVRNLLNEQRKECSAIKYESFIFSYKFFLPLDKMHS